MHLAPDTFDLLRRILSGDGHHATEQRRERRETVGCTLSVTPLSDEDGRAPIPLRVCDVSRNGIAVLCTRPMSVGGEFVLHIPVDGPRGVSCIRCVIRSCRLVGDHAFRIGAEFDALELAPPRTPIAHWDYA